MTRKPALSRLLPRVLLALLAVAVLAATLPSLAQGPGRGGGRGPGAGAAAGPAGHGAHHLGRLVRFLDLTDAQVDAARALFESARAEAEPIRDEQKALHEDLRALLDGESPDAAEVGALAIALHDNRQQVRALFEAAWKDFEELLTAEQREKLEQLDRVRHHFGPGRRGPGAAGGPAEDGFGAGLGLGFGAGFGPGDGSCLDAV